MGDEKVLKGPAEVDAIWSNVFQFEASDVTRIAFGEVRLGETRFHTAVAMSRADALELAALLIQHAGGAPAEPSAEG